MLFHSTVIQSVAFASTAGGQRNCNGAAFASLKKFVAHFFNHACGITETKEAPMQLLVKFEAVRQYPARTVIGSIHLASDMPIARVIIIIKIPASTEASIGYSFYFY